MAKIEKRIPREGTCSLCGGKYENFGNNPEPLKRYKERCCHKCNTNKVIPARIAQMFIDQSPKPAA